MPGDLCTAPRIISLSLLSLATDVTDATLGASDLEPRQELLAPPHKREGFLAAAYSSMNAQKLSCKSSVVQNGCELLKGLCEYSTEPPGFISHGVS